MNWVRPISKIQYYRPVILMKAWELIATGYVQMSTKLLKYKKFTKILKGESYRLVILVKVWVSNCNSLYLTVNVQMSTILLIYKNFTKIKNGESCEILKLKF